MEQRLHRPCKSLFLLFFPLGKSLLSHFYDAFDGRFKLAAIQFVLLGNLLVEVKQLLC